MLNFMFCMSYLLLFPISHLYNNQRIDYPLFRKPGIKKFTDNKEKTVFEHYVSLKPFEYTFTAIETHHVIVLHKSRFI